MRKAVKGSRFTPGSAYVDECPVLIIAMRDIVTGGRSPEVDVRRKKDFLGFRVVRDRDPTTEE
jgi:hypothetical protein